MYPCLTQTSLEWLPFKRKISRCSQLAIDIVACNWLRNHVHAYRMWYTPSGRTRSVIDLWFEPHKCGILEPHEVTDQCAVRNSYTRTRTVYVTPVQQCVYTHVMFPSSHMCELGDMTLVLDRV